MVLPFERIDASESTPYAFLAFGTFTSFLITLYIFYNEQDHQESTKPRSQQSKHDQHVQSEPQLPLIKDQKPNNVQEELADKSDIKLEIVNDDNKTKHKKGELSVVNALSLLSNEPVEPIKNVVEEKKMDQNHKDQANSSEPDNNIVADQNKESCCCSCIKPYYRKYTKEIKWIVVVYQVISLIYTFTYTWRLASKAVPDKASITWNNYQVFAKAFAISSHFKTVITTAFVIASKNFILKQLKVTIDVKAKYDTSVMVYLFCFAISCAFYGVTFFWTHLLPGLFIFCPLILVGAAGFGIFLGIIHLVGSRNNGNDDWERDYIIWIGGLLCTITAVICVIVMEAMVLFWDKPDSWMDAVFIVFSQRDSEVFMDGISTKTEKLINFIGMLL